MQRAQSSSFGRQLERNQTHTTKGCVMPQLDERDQQILAERIRVRDAYPDPRVGDYVRFPNDRVARISYIWPDSFQTSAGGSWYLGDLYTQFSGQLDRGVPQLTRTAAVLSGGFWFFHHDYHRAHNGIQVTAPCRVYTSAIDPRALYGKPCTTLGASR